MFDGSGSSFPGEMFVHPFVPSGYYLHPLIVLIKVDPNTNKSRCKSTTKVDSVHYKKRFIKILLV